MCYGCGELLSESVASPTYHASGGATAGPANPNLRACPSCDRAVSVFAPACPYCRHPFPDMDRRYSRGTDQPAVSAPFVGTVLAVAGAALSLFFVIWFFAFGPGKVALSTAASSQQANSGGHRPRAGSSGFRAHGVTFPGPQNSPSPPGGTSAGLAPPATEPTDGQQQPAFAPTPGQGPTLPPEPGPRPLPREEGHAHLGNASLHVVNDGSGHETCVGRVLIVNDGPYNVADFRLSLKVNGLAYVLAPYEGTVDLPMPIVSRHIAPGGSLDVPVMTTGYYSSYSVYGMKSVVLNASLDGPPGVVTDEASVL